MTKDEMKNRISLALKDPILQQGFEIICKENAELKEQCLILADCNTCNSTCKTENIEMKEQLAKAKELIGELISSLSVVGECEEECELLNRAEQFLREVGDDSKRFEKGY